MQASIKWLNAVIFLITQAGVNGAFSEDYLKPLCCCAEYYLQCLCFDEGLYHSGKRLSWA